MPVNSSLRQQASSVRLHQVNSVERVSAWKLQHILSSIKSLTIQFNTSGVSSVTIESVRLASASSSVVSSTVATYVENCSCLVNFTGNSCSQCAPGKWYLKDVFCFTFVNNSESFVVFRGSKILDNSNVLTVTCSCSVDALVGKTSQH